MAEDFSNLEIEQLTERIEDGMRELDNLLTPIRDRFETYLPNDMRRLVRVTDKLDAQLNAHDIRCFDTRTPANPEILALREVILRVQTFFALVSALSMATPHLLGDLGT